MSTRPRPRPRPRLKAAVAPPSSPGPSSATSPPPPHANETSLEDEDALFLRNRTRTAQTWKKLNQITEAKAASRRTGSVSASSDEERISSPRSRNHRRKAQRDKDRDTSLPDWTKMPSNAILISSDDDDDDIILQRVDNSTPDDKRDNEQTPRRSSKRPRSRSRSITPPPALPPQALQAAGERIRQLIGAVPRPPSPTWVVDEPPETVILDPELASIARQVQSEQFVGEGTPAPDEGGPENVVVKVRWKSHPLNASSKPEIWGFKMKRHDPFRHLFDEVADIASILSNNLIVSYDGKRIFPSATPHSIGIWSEAELEACDKITYEYIRANHQRSPSVALPQDQGIDERSPSGTRSPSLAAQLSDSDGGTESASGGDTFRLTLRSGKTKDIVLTVRSTTKCGAIVKAFLKKAGLADQYAGANAPAGGKGKGRGKKTHGVNSAGAGPMLMLDGDKMDPETEIGEADLEDGDLVEVVGL